ncbi:MAG: FGGY family carbohydrate kinase [Planctomycetota bacterium]
MSYKVIVLDIGKTHKKMYVYDENLRCLNPDEEGVQFDTLTWETPTGQVLECDDMDAISTWMLGCLRNAADRYDDIRAISVSTHGATIALLGDRRDQIFEGDGGLVFPIISYENEVGEQTHESFYTRIGMSPKEVQRKTATPALSWLLNHAKQIHYLQREAPNRFEQVTDILMFPQYIGYLLSGMVGVEPTYLGCHGCLLDASGNHYSEVAEELGVVDLLPDVPLSNTWDVLGTLKPDLAESTGLREDCVVTMGVHDSNAALVPYLGKGMEKCVIQDSGTWVVTMAPLPDAEVFFEEDELGLEVFFNRDIYGNPVKTTIFRGGAEFDFYRSNVLASMDRPQGIDQDLLVELVENREAFALPTIERGAGLFPDSVARLEATDVIFRDASTAWHVVDLGIAVQGWCALQMAAGRCPEKVFIEGNVGRHNPVYRGVISGLLPNSTVKYGSGGGAPFGAAILGAAAVEKVRPEELSKRYEIELQNPEALRVSSGKLAEYAQSFLERL